jgi:hypothetical protein
MQFELFYAAFQLLRSVEFLIKLGSKRKAKFVRDDESRNDLARDVRSSVSMNELFRMDNSSSRPDIEKFQENNILALFQPFSEKNQKKNP